MADTLRMKRGDTAPRFRAQLLDGATPVSLTGAAAKFLMKRDGAVVLTGALTIEDQTTSAGWVNRAWGSTDLAVAGLYTVEVEVTWADSTIQTFPVEGKKFLSVSEDLG